ncbi:MAG: hypothetical protein ABFE07_26345 [Armatimonadia bacterium]
MSALEMDDDVDSTSTTHPATAGQAVAIVLASVMLLALAVHWGLTWLLAFDEPRHSALMRLLFGIDAVCLDCDWDRLRCCWNLVGILIVAQVLLAYRLRNLGRRWYTPALAAVAGTLAAVGILQLVYRFRVGHWPNDWLSDMSLMLMAAAAGLLFGLASRWRSARRGS